MLDFAVGFVFAFEFYGWILGFFSGFGLDEYMFGLCLGLGWVYGLVFGFDVELGLELHLDWISSWFWFCLGLGFRNCVWGFCFGLVSLGINLVSLCLI